MTTVVNQLSSKLVMLIYLAIFIVCTLLILLLYLIRLHILNCLKCNRKPRQIDSPSLPIANNSIEMSQLYSTVASDEEPLYVEPINWFSEIHNWNRQFKYNNNQWNNHIAHRIHGLRSHFDRILFKWCNESLLTENSVSNSVTTQSYTMFTITNNYTLLRYSYFIY